MGVQIEIRPQSPNTQQVKELSKKEENTELREYKTELIMEVMHFHT